MKKLIIIVICVMITVPIFTQNQDWEVYIGSPGHNEYATDVIETYDRGYYLGAWTGGTNGLGWNIKTDIDGNVLYDKILSHNYCQMDSWAVVEDSAGNKYCCGPLFIDNDSWPFVIKFDPCGEKIWCKYFPVEAGENSAGAWDVIINSQGEIIVLTSYFSDELESSIIYLIGLDENGKELWKKPYASKHDYPLIWNPVGYDLMEFNNEYYIAGDCYWPYPNNPTHVFLRPLFIGIDSDFNEKWVMPFHALDSVFGWAERLIPLNDNVIMGAGIRRVRNSDDANSLLMFFTPEGVELGYNQIRNSQISHDVIVNYIHDIERINDTLFLAASPFGPHPGTNPVGELVFDTAANLYSFHSRPNTQNKPSMVKTYDGNYVIATSIQQGNFWDIYLYKIDENLEMVPFDTTQHVYDSLCPHPIQSGTMDLTDCLIVTDIGELPTPDVYYESLRWIPIKAFPNPVKDDKVTLEFENTDYHSNMELRVYNNTGHSIHSQKIYKGQQDTDVNVSAWPKGVYIAVIYSNGGAVGKVKFVVG
jgi:hypothetical protein